MTHYSLQIHKLVNSIWNKEELLDQWKESIVVPIHKKGDKLTRNCGISLLSTSNKILSNILLSRLSSYIDEIIVNHQGGFRCNRSSTDQIFCICNTLEKNGSTMRQYIRYLHTSRKPGEVLYNILTEFGVPMKLFRLLKMCFRICQ
jgi:hypothetical protein